jgi:hypothetical protein
LPLFLLLFAAFSGLDGPIAEDIGMKKRFNHWINSLGLLITYYAGVSVIFYSVERLV